MTIDLTDIIVAVIALLATSITKALIPWIQANVDIKKREKLTMAVETFVFAAEQLYGSGWGQDKMRHVQEKLKAEGYTVDIDLIEATVKKYFGHYGNSADPAFDDGEEESSEEEEPQTPLM